MLYQLAFRCDDERQGLLDDLVSGLANGGDGLKIQDGVWIIDTNGPANEIRDRIRECLEDGEAVIVSVLAGYAAWHGFDGEATDWLLAHL